MNYYPDDNTSLYYVEFDRGGHKKEFTLFRRQYIHSLEEWDKYIQQVKIYSPGMLALMSNEGHPWNMFTANYKSDGHMPDQSWIKWMVDALNEKVRRVH